jgi:hypothetical protein
MSEQERYSRYPDEGRWVEREQDSRGVSPGWLLAGVALVGLGVLAWYYLEPDLRRYLKIRSM